jgi:hypothetical protein
MLRDGKHPTEATCAVAGEDKEDVVEGWAADADVVHGDAGLAEEVEGADRRCPRRSPDRSRGRRYGAVSESIAASATSITCHPAGDSEAASSAARRCTLG